MRRCVIEWVPDGFNNDIGDMEIDRRSFQIRMSEKPLNDRQRDSGFHQMRGKTVPQGMRRDRLAEPGFLIGFEYYVRY